MALQMKPIKASNRQILPSLNRLRYEQTTTSNGRTYYRKKKPIKSERKVMVDIQGKQRISLENKALAKRTARARQGAAIPKDRFEKWTNPVHKETPISLKNGIVAMAKKSGVTDPELFRKLNKMDADRLQEMYRKDDLIFEVAFTYDPHGDPYSGKEDDLNFLVSVYEERFGVL